MAVPMLDPDRLTVFDPSVLPIPRPNCAPAHISDGEAIPDGSRNATLASRAGQMRRMGFSEPEIVAALLVVNEKCTPPLSETEVSSIAHSVAAYPPERPAQVLADRSRELRLIDDVQLIHQPRPRYQVDQLTLQDTLVVIYGLPGGGKTFFEVDRGCCLAKGTPFLGHDITQRGPFVHIAAEGASALGLRVAAWKNAHGFGLEGSHRLPRDPAGREPAGPCGRRPARHARPAAQPRRDRIRHLGAVHGGGRRELDPRHGAGR